VIHPRATCPTTKVS